MTCRRLLRAWQQTGVWQRLHELSMAIDELNGGFGAAHDQLSGGAAAERIWNAFDGLSKDRWHAAARTVVDEMRADIVRWRAAAVAAARPHGNE